ncbi:hypothetical protein BDQ17DRAFT_1343013 [Cyathus striatus]|nr:hypothetical protein BDQ17DRAFT_1343013 [Cyathus striatus]
MPIIEIATFPSTTEFISDPIKTGAPAFSKIVQAEGFHGLYTGTQVEDEKTGYLVVIWETYEHHKIVTEQADYPQLIETLKACFSGSIDVQHVEFNADISAVFEAPVTEFAAATLKPGETKEDAILPVQKLTAALDNTEGTVKPAVWGASRERADTLIFCVGWPSKQVHLDSVKGSKTLPPIIGDLRAVVELSPVHIHFKKFAP